MWRGVWRRHQRDALALLRSFAASSREQAWSLTPALEHRLNSMAQRCDELERLLMAGGAQGAAPAALREDLPSMAQLQQEHSRLHAVAEQWRALRAAQREHGELEALRRDPDPALAREAEAEQAALQAKMGEMQEQLLISLLPRQEGDEHRGAIVEVRAGAGGAEASLFAAELLSMYAAWSSSKGWRCEALESSPSEAGGVRTASLAVSGAGAFSTLRWEAGVHRVQRVPVTETQGRLHTSTASVVVLPEADEVEVRVNESDLQVDAFRASGPGGQHVNSTCTAVRVTHVPTGVVVACQDERSLILNRAKAMRVLRAKLLERQRQQESATQAAERRAQAGTGERNERIRTYNFGQDRVTDHRVGLTFQGLDEIMSGRDPDALDEVHEALRQAEEARMLEQLLESES